MRFLFVLSAIFLGLCINPQPAEAAAVPVFIDISVGSQNSNARAGAKYVDKYTKTRFVYGACRTNYRCIRIRIDNSRTNGTGWSSWRGTARPVVTITVNPARGDAYMKRLFAHEVGHAMYLKHSTYRTNLMYPTLHTKAGNLVSFRFTAPQIKTLRRH